MPEPRMPGEALSPLRYPPEGSVLKRVLERLDPPKKGEPGLLAEFIVQASREPWTADLIAQLEAAGLPEDKIPPEVLKIINIGVLCSLSTSAGEISDRIESRPKPVGAPTIELITLMVIGVQILNERSRHPEASTTAVCREVAKSLGPGLREDHIRRAHAKAVHRVRDALGHVERPEGPDSDDLGRNLEELGREAGQATVRAVARALDELAR